MKRLIIEAIGTFFLTVAVTLTGDALAIGLMLMAMIYVGEHISGGFYNPAVTVAMWLRGALQSGHVVGYIAAQSLGALAAGAAFYALTGHMYIARLPENAPVLLALIPEILMTFVFCSVILVVATTDRFRTSGLGGLVIGLTLSAVAYFNGLYNPAIGFSSVVSGLIAHDGAAVSTNLIAHVAGPLIAALLAASWVRYVGTHRTANHH
jgi:aquaporin Z